MAGGRLWTKEEDEYLLDRIGKASVKAIAYKLDRTEMSIKMRMYKLGVSNFRMATGAYTANELSKLIQVDPSTILRWIRLNGLKAKHNGKKSKGKYFYIQSSDFWEWAEHNKKHINFSKIKPKSLLPEPDWFEAERKKDSHQLPKRRLKQWTDQEEAKVLNLCRLGYSKKEIAAELDRSENAVHRKISKLRADGILKKKVIMIRWTQEEIDMMLELEKQGLSDKEIAYELGRDKDHIVQNRKLMRDRGQYQGYKNR